MKDFLTRYHPAYLKTIIYMLQSSEYKVPEYVAWLHRTRNFRSVTKRRELDYTRKAQLLLLAVSAVALLLVAIAIWLFVLSINENNLLLFFIACVTAFSTPFVVAYGVVVPLWLGYVLIQRPEEKKMIAAAREIIAKHKGYKIAIAGSYGKTTAKEVLSAVLGQNRKVAVTPGNMNTMIGISRFATKLKGDEDILVFELGEEKPSDVARLCELVQPDAGFITGISAAHMASFGSMEAITSTIFELRDYLGEKLLYKNGESEEVAKKAGDDPLLFTRAGVDGWVVSDVDISIKGTRFSVQKGSKIIWADSKLLGEHNIGILVAAIALASKLKLTIAQIADGVDHTVPFEHRMEPRRVNNAWIIDDTYNGNFAGIQAGLALLTQLQAERKIYVTPGLVEQGDDTKHVHREIGKLIAAADVDQVVLMKNSVVDFISQGLQEGGYKGRVLVVDDPLNFYTNLDQFVAHGDIVLMQNDWTDNYN